MSLDFYHGLLDKNVVLTAASDCDSAALADNAITRAKLLVGFSIDDCRAIEEENQFDHAIALCEQARELLAPLVDDLALLADAFATEARARWFLDEHDLPLIFSLYDQSLSLIRQVLTRPEDSETQAEKAQRHWAEEAQPIVREALALVMHYMNQYAKSIEQFQSVLEGAIASNQRERIVDSSLKLANVLGDAGQTAEALRTLDRLKARVALEGPDELLRLKSSEAEIHRQHGDLSTALSVAKEAGQLLFDHARQIHGRSNLVIRIVRFHTLYGDYETARQILSTFEKLYPQASGGGYHFNRLMINSQIAAATSDIDLLSSSLAGIESRLNEHLYADVAEEWVHVHIHRAKLLVLEDRPQAALQHLSRRQPLSALRAGEVTLPTFPLLIYYCDLALQLPGSQHELSSLITLLVSDCACCDVLDRWRVPWLVGRYCLRSSDFDQATNWAWLALEELHQLPRQLPDNGAGQKNRMIRSLHEPWILLENLSVQRGDAIAASRYFRQRLANEMTMRRLQSQTLTDGTSHLAGMAPENHDRRWREWWRSVQQSIQQFHEGASVSEYRIAPTIQEPIKAEFKDRPHARKTVPASGKLPAPITMLRVSGEGGCVRIRAESLRGACEHEVTVALPELNALAFSLLTQIEGESDWLGQAQRLYQLLLAPLEHVFTETIALFPSSALMLLPFGVLHDGVHFAIENHRFQYGFAERGVPAQSFGRLVFAGTSAHDDGHPTLAAEEEYRDISPCFTEVVALLDDDFHQDSLREALRGLPDIVHIGCHLDIDTPSVEQSRLLLSNRRSLALHDVINDSFRWHGVDTLFLGACDGGLSAGPSADPRPYLTPADMFSIAGVRNIITSHGRIEDERHRRFTRLFYLQLADARDVPTALQHVARNCIQRQDNCWASYGHWVG